MGTATARRARASASHLIRFTDFRLPPLQPRLADIERGFFLSWSNYPTIHASFRPDLMRDGELPRLPRGTLPATGHPLLRTSPERVLFSR